MACTEHGDIAGILLHSLQCDLPCDMDAGFGGTCMLLRSLWEYQVLTARSRDRHGCTTASLLASGCTQRWTMWMGNKHEELAHLVAWENFSTMVSTRSIAPWPAYARLQRWVWGHRKPEYSRRSSHVFLCSSLPGRHTTLTPCTWVFSTDLPKV